MHNTKLSKLSRRRSKFQLEKRAARIKSRKFKSKVMDGVSTQKGSILWTWQETVNQLLRRGPGSTGKRGW